MSGPTKAWLSPVNDCDVCQTQISAELGTLIYDCSVLRGPWGLVCHNCFIRDNGDLGIGRGQMYCLTELPNSTRMWLCVGGSDTQPIKYRNFNVELSTIGFPAPKWQYTHEDFDGPEDNRGGHCDTASQCFSEIDEWWDDQIDPPEAEKV